MENHISRKAAIELLKKYNKDPFHLRHALTVEAVMRWYAKELGYADEEDFWELVGLLHDIDFEVYPEEHCIKAPEMLGWPPDEVLQKTLDAMKAGEASITAECARL